MLKKIRQVIIRLGLVLAVMMWLSLSDSPAWAQPQPPTQIDDMAPVTLPAAQTAMFDLCAGESDATMPDGETIPIWGYGLLETTTTGVVCNVQLPGPTLRVNEGDVVTVNLTNYLTVPTSMLFLGQNVGASGGTAGLFTTEVAPNGTISYAFTAGAPGTYLYESGTVDQPQVAMGLYGALVVDSATPGQAYADASTAYDIDEVLVLSEIDPNLNADPAGFDMTNYHPIYWLMNGRAYPDTLDADNATTQPYSSLIEAAVGDKVLARYLNAGAVHHTISSLNRYQRVIAQDADEMDVSTQQFQAVAQTVASGQTTDTIIEVAAEGSFPLFNRQLHITNGTAASTAHFVPGGGMMTSIEVGPGGPADDVVNFDNFTILPYGGSQDADCSGPVDATGTSLSIVGNCWKRIEFPYEVTANTVIEFDFSSTAEGEVHGIGLDNDDDPNSAPKTFQLYGTQTHAIQAYNDYSDPPGGIKHYTIPVGQFYAGTMTHLTFANDDDPPGGYNSPQSTFSNIQVYEAPPLSLNVNGTGADLSFYGGTGGGTQNPPASSTAAIEASGGTLRITGNGWYKVGFPYNVTASTVLEFDFESSVPGEIHGIGFDTDDAISPTQTFQLYGNSTQTWGLQNHNDYAGETPKHYTIPVGTHFTGNMIYLIFANDDDANAAAESVFSNIQVHE
jgi:FtsP/CotA-like multicopper oxidase with cupredoxin domain